MAAGLGLGVAAGPAGAAITFRSASGGVDATGSTLTVNAPAGTRLGDVLLASVDVRGDAQITAPAGWTLVRADVDEHVQVKQTFLKVVGTPAEPSAYTWTLDGSQGAAGTIADYVGVSNVTPQDTASAAQVNPDFGTKQQVAPSITTANAGALVVSLFGTSSATSSTPPPETVERTDTASTTGTYRVDSQIADATQLAPGATGSRTATSNRSGAGIGQTVALRPAATLFGPNSFVNVPIPASPALDANSSAMVTNLNGTGASAGMSGPFYPNLTNDQGYGFPIVTATTSDPNYTQLNGTVYPNDDPVQCRIPADAVGNSGTDGHLTVLQPLAEGGQGCEFWQFSHPDGSDPTASTIEKDCAGASDPHVVWGPNRNAWGTSPCKGKTGTGAVASGFSNVAGVIRPEELDGTTPIPHALALALPSEVVKSGQSWPASRGDGECTAANCIPEGARLQLDPSYVPPSSMPAWEKKVVVALQSYGGYVADRGGTLEVRAEYRFDDSVWTKRGIAINAHIADIPWDRLRVLQTTSGPTRIPSWWTLG